MRKCLPVNSTIRLKLPEKKKQKKRRKIKVKNKVMLISFQCQTLPAFGHQLLRQQQRLTKELKPFSVYVMQEQNKKRRQTAASNKQANTAAATAAATRAALAVAVAVAQLQCVSCRYSISKIRICRAWPLRKA